MKILKTLAVWACLAFAGTSIFAQSVTFTAEELVVLPSQITSGKCVQVGIFMTYTGPTATWGHFEASLDYNFPAGYLSGVPFVDLGDFDNPALPGITNPATILTNADGAGTTSSCIVANIINSATLGGSSFNFMTGAGGAAAVLTEQVVHGATSGTVDITSLSFGSLFTTTDGGTYLMAVLEFPIAGPAPVGQIDVVFRTGVAQNFITDGVTTLDPVLDDGWIQVFEPMDCTGATVADDQGAGSGTNININYEDINAGGLGGQITFTMPTVTAPDEITVVGSDGFSSTIAAPVAGNNTLQIDTAGDSSPLDTVGSVTYTITYWVYDLQTVPVLTPGVPCIVTVNWAAPSCNVTFVPAPPTIGNACSYNVTALNARFNGAHYGTIAGGGNGFSTNLTAPVRAANQLTFTGQISASIVGADAGTYTANLVGPNSVATSCNNAFGFTCPVMTSVVVTPNPAGIEDNLTVTFAATDALDYDITYNGVTTTGVLASPFVLPNVASGADLDVTVTANGNGPTGTPCSDSMNGAVTFDAAACGAVTLVPAPPVDGYVVGTNITVISVSLTGASSVTIGGLNATSSVDPDANAVVTWTYPVIYPVTGPDSLAVVATNPNGVVTNCADIVIDVDCATGNITSLPPTGTTGDIVVQSDAIGFSYDIYFSAICGQTQFDVLQSGSYVGTVTIGSSGFGVLSSVPIESDVCYYVVCPGGVIASNLRADTVPTLGEWGTLSFIALILFAGLVVLRKKN